MKRKRPVRQDLTPAQCNPITDLYVYRPTKEDKDFVIDNLSLDINQHTINFVLPRLQKRQEEFKKKIGHLNKEDYKTFLKARMRSYPFDQAQCPLFNNRAASKLASLDEQTDGAISLLNKQFIHFVDIAGGPGSFVQYVSTKRTVNTQYGCYLGFKAFGMTIKNKNGLNQYNLWEKYNGRCRAYIKNCLATPEFFFQYPSPEDDTRSGDVTNLEEINYFCDFVLKNMIFETTQQYADLVMADGAFEQEYETNDLKEHSHRRLFLGEILCALRLLDHGGTFVIKIFDIFTKFTTSLLYILVSEFEVCHFCKPAASRPSNSEKYVVCQNRTSTNLDIINHLEKLMTNPILDSSSDFSLLTMNEFTNTKFYSFIREFNTIMTIKQTDALLNIIREYEAIQNQHRCIKFPFQSLSSNLNVWGMNFRRIENIRKKTDQEIINTFKFQLPHFHSNFSEQSRSNFTHFDYEGEILLLFSSKGNLYKIETTRSLTPLSFKIKLPTYSVVLAEVKYDVLSQQVVFIKLMDALLLSGFDLNSFMFPSRREFLAKYTHALTNIATRRKNIQMAQSTEQSIDKKEKNRVSICNCTGFDSDIFVY